MAPKTPKNDINNVISRLERLKWFRDFDRQRQDQIRMQLNCDPRSFGFVENVLNEMQKLDSPWCHLTPAQVKAQIIGALDLFHEQQRLRESLDELAWYKNLAPSTQAEVERTVECSMLIMASSPHRARRPDEQKIKDTNPWQLILSQGQRR